MANTLTGLIPVLDAALDTVSREMVGLIPAVRRDASADQVAKDQTLRIPIAPVSTPVAITPGVTAPDSGDQTIGYTDVTISKQYMVPIRWNGDEQTGMGAKYRTTLQDQFSQAFRSLVALIEADLAALYVNASRAYGTSGTTPFATTLDASAEIRRILADNGAPMSDLQLVINTLAGAKLRALGQLTKANEAGTDAGLRRGELLNVNGFSIRESAGIKNHTAGTAANYLVDLVAGYAVGDTTVHLDTGTGTHLAGDVISFESDAEKYVIKTGAAGDGDKDIVLGAPGLRAILANNKTATTNAAYTANLAFDRNALLLAARQPKMPEGGDAADDVMSIADPVSGLVFQVAQYRQYRQMKYEVGIAWGVACPKPDHLAILLG